MDDLERKTKVWSTNDDQLSARQKRTSRTSKTPERIVIAWRFEDSRPESTIGQGKDQCRSDTLRRPVLVLQGKRGEGNQQN